MIGFIRTTVLGGVTFLLPVVVLILVLGKAVQYARLIAEPIADRMPPVALLGVAPGFVIALVLTVLACFLAGLVARSRRARGWVRTIEEGILDKIPAYSLIKTKAVGLLTPEGEASASPVLIRFDDQAQLGIEIDRLETGEVAVFLPGAPDAWAGTLILVEAARVTRLNVPLKTVIDVHKRIGIGTGQLLSAALPKSGN